MSESATRIDARPARLLRAVMKLPLLLYRLRLGQLLAHRFMCLTHVGRRSGKSRHTVLAVLRYDPQSRQVMVVSARRASDWYRNIQHAPALEVEIGRERYTPIQRDLNTEEISVLLDGYRKQHPIISRILCRIPGWSMPDSEEKLMDLARGLRGVAFQPRMT